MIVIIDYGMGNLRSVQKGFERVGYEARVSGDAAVVAEASKVVLPGVGAFADAMAELEQRGLVDPVLAAIDRGKPFLGVCLGLQLLFERSHEDGQHQGLGVLTGDVVRFELPRQFKVPHMGWNQLVVERRPPILDGVDSQAHFYFVHSYCVAPTDPQVIAAQTDYGGLFPSVVWRDNLFATQFHPEKSQAQGLRILRNFAALD